MGIENIWVWNTSKENFSICRQVNSRYSQALEASYLFEELPELENTVQLKSEPEGMANSFLGDK